MANTEDLKSSEVKPLESSSLSSGISPKVEMINEAKFGILLHNKVDLICNCKSCRIAREILRTDEMLKELIRTHECLLNTLAPSKNQWIREVYKNAKAYYKTWLKKYIII